MEEGLRELSDTELEAVAGGFFNFSQYNTNFDSNQGTQAQVGIQNNNFDSNQGNQGVSFFA
jgi:hypothetical protein